MGFNNTSTLVGHFVSSPREREKRDKRDSTEDERKGQGRKRNWNESEETEEIKTYPSTLTCYKDSRPCPTGSQYQLDAPATQDTRHLRHTQPPPGAIVRSSDRSYHMKRNQYRFKDGFIIYKLLCIGYFNQTKLQICMNYKNVI